MLGHKISSIHVCNMYVCRSCTENPKFAAAEGTAQTFYATRLCARLLFVRVRVYVFDCVCVSVCSCGCFVNNENIFLD